MVGTNFVTNAHRAVVDRAAFISMTLLFNIAEY